VCVRCRWLLKLCLVVAFLVTRSTAAFRQVPVGRGPTSGASRPVDTGSNALLEERRGASAVATARPQNRPQPIVRRDAGSSSSSVVSSSATVTLVCPAVAAVWQRSLAAHGLRFSLVSLAN
jgi:hypothetical protein